MSSIRHILVPHDFGPCSQRALDVALDLAAAAGARVSVLHAYFVPRYGYLADVISQSFSETHEQTSRKAIDDVVQGIRGRAPKLSVASHVVAGPPAEQILSFVEREAVDLVVMGTHGHRGLARAVFGSVADQVLRQSPIPVLVVPPSPPLSGVLD